MKLRICVFDATTSKTRSTVSRSRRRSWSSNKRSWAQRRCWASRTSIIPSTMRRQTRKKKEAKTYQGDLNRRASSTWIIWNQTGFKSHECSPCNKFGTCSLLLSINQCIANAHLLLRKDLTTLMQSVGALTKRTNKCKTTLMRKIRRYQIG